MVGVTSEVSHSFNRSIVLARRSRQLNSTKGSGCNMNVADITYDCTSTIVCLDSLANFEVGHS